MSQDKRKRGDDTTSASDESQDAGAGSEQDDQGVTTWERERQEVQQQLIEKALGGSKGGPQLAAGFSGRPPDDRELSSEPPDFLYQSDAMLVREEHREQVEVILNQLGVFDDTRTPEPVVAGVRLLPLRLESVNDFNARHVLEAVRDGGNIRVPGRPRVSVHGLGPGAAALNHVVSIAGNAGGCPAVEPEPVPAGAAPCPGYTPDRAAGEGVRVVVVDTGLDLSAPKRSPWLNGVIGDPDYAIRGKALEHYAGHGTFIAGLVRAVAPAAEVRVRKVFGFGGSATESDLVKALNSVMEKDYPDIISMSAGCYSHEQGEPLAFEVFNELRLRRHKGVAFVVAAGNEAGRQPFWPAAAPYTVSVGALATSWKGRARFSNHGGWVDVYAPGQDLVNAFPIGTYTYREPPYSHPPTQPPLREENFYGMARWSGTSFSTPIVAGLIAARMSHTGENGRDAAAALLAEARLQAQPGVGAVLLPEG
jgi:hypothetical protein